MVPVPLRPHIDEPLSGIVLAPEQPDLGQLGPEMYLFIDDALLQHEDMHAGAEVWSGLGWKSVRHEWKNRIL